MTLCIGGCGGAEPSGPGPLPASSPAVTPSPVSPSTPNPATLFALQGYVNDGLRALSGVVMDIVDGPLAGATTVTDSSGKFAFPEPIALPLTIRLRRDGYAEKREVLREKRGVYSIELESLEVPFNFEPGNYALRLSLNPADAISWPNLPQAPCAGIPTEALTRRIRITRPLRGRKRTA